MSSKEIFKMLEVLRTDPKAQELLAGYGKPEDESKALAEVAGKLGYDISAEELRSCMEEAEKRIRENTKVTAEVIEQLPDEDLSKVAGGKRHSDCKDTFKDRENCWFNDGCDIVNNHYDDYLCHLSYYKHSCKEKSSTCSEEYDCGWAYVLGGDT